MTVKEIFDLPSPQKEEKLRDVVRWVFDNEDVGVITESLLSREDKCRGVKSRQLQLENCLDGDLLYRIAFNFEDGFNHANPTSL